MKFIIPPPIVMIISGGMMYGAHKYVPQFSAEIVVPEVLPLIVAAAAFIILAIAIGGFGKAKTTVSPLAPEKASSLVTGGIYRLSRNPMYLGMALLLLAFALKLGTLWGLVFIAVFVIYINIMQIKPEEKALKDLFGDEYEAYCKQVRRWI